MFHWFWISLSELINNLVDIIYGFSFVVSLIRFF